MHNGFLNRYCALDEKTMVLVEDAKFKRYRQNIQRNKRHVLDRGGNDDNATHTTDGSGSYGFASYSGLQSPGGAEASVEVDSPAGSTGSGLSPAHQATIVSSVHSIN